MARNDLVPGSNSNPAFNPQYLEDVIDVPNAEVMTVSGSITKTAICLALIVVAAAFSWNILAQGYGDMANLFAGISAITALILGFVIIFKRLSPAIQFLVPLYALAEGVLLGNISFIFEKMFPGIVYTAVEGTLLCLAIMLGLFKFGVIRATEKFRSTLILATITIFGVYLIDFILMFFGIRVPMINTASNFGILFSFAVIVVASLNLILDFDFIERASARFFPKHVEWYGAFGLLVTIVWLYIEILKLLAKFQRRD